MKPKYLFLALCFFFVFRTFSIEPFIYNQDLRFRYDIEGVTNKDDVETTTLNYRFNLSMPVLSYRLGVMTLQGAIDYDSLLIGDRKDSDLGLRSYGVSLNLFPYRRFHIGLTYFNYEAPKLFSNFYPSSNRFGINYSLSIPNKPHIFFRFDRRENSFLNENDYFNQYEIKGNQVTKIYKYYFQINRDEYFYRNSSEKWSANYGSLNYERKIFKDWDFYGFLNSFTTDESYLLTSTANLFKTFGKNLIMTSCTLGYGRGNGSSSTNISLNQSGTIPLNGVTFYGALSESYNTSSNNSNRGSGDFGYTILAGALKDLGKNFKVYGDAAVSHQSFVINQDTKSYHIGFSEGGLLPQFLQRTIFNLTEFSLQRRLKREYPPNYIPPEISLEILTSRQLNIGNHIFSIDYYHSDGGGDFKRNYMRGDGVLHLNRHFDFYLRAEYTDEKSLEGLKKKNNYIYIQNRFKIGRSSIVFSYSDTDGKYRNLEGIETISKSSSYSISFFSRIWKIPFGISYRNYKMDNENFKSFYFFQNFTFRKIVLRTLFEQNYLPNNVKNYRFTFEVGRSFDSIILFGNKLRR